MQKELAELFIELEQRVKDLVELRDEVDHYLQWGKVWEARNLIDLDREQNSESKHSD